jgi:hypothetical protein
MRLASPVIEETKVHYIVLNCYFGLCPLSKYYKITYQKLGSTTVIMEIRQENISVGSPG